MAVLKSAGSDVPIAKPSASSKMPKNVAPIVTGKQKASIVQKTAPAAILGKVTNPVMKDIAKSIKPTTKTILSGK